MLRWAATQQRLGQFKTNKIPIWTELAQNEMPVLIFLLEFWARFCHLKVSSWLELRVGDVKRLWRKRGKRPDVRVSREGRFVFRLPSDEGVWWALHLCPDFSRFHLVIRGPRRQVYRSFWK